MATIKELQNEIHSTNVEKGFWDDVEKISTIEDLSFRKSVEKAFQSQKLALVTSELSEALEYIRKNDFRPISPRAKQLVEMADDDTFVNVFQENVKDTYQDELADSVIRLLDIAGGENIDLEWHIEQKLKYNKTRAKMHGKQF